MSSSSSPCAACKFLRRKCTQECVFAPYFPPDQPQKFANVHKVFGASNVAKLLNELNTSQREDAVNSLAYEAEARLRDPIYGCVGLISILQHRLKQVHSEILAAKKELSTYIGPSAMLPILQQTPYPYMMYQQQGVSSSMPIQYASSSAMVPYNMAAMFGAQAGPSPHGGALVIRDPQQQQQMIEAQQLAAVVAAREQQELMRAYEQQQQLLRLNSVFGQACPGGVAVFDQAGQNNAGGFDQAGPSSAAGFEPAGQGSAGGFNHVGSSEEMPPSLALASFSNNPYQVQSQMLLQTQQQQQDQQSPSLLEKGSGSDEGRSVGPSC